MAGEFKAVDVARIKQSVRKDGYWTFFKRKLQIQHSLLNRKLHIADIGCGTGDNCILVHNTLSYVSDKYTCIDGSPEMLKFVEVEGFTDTKLICQNLDENFKLPKADVYLAKFMFHHLKFKKEVLESIYSALPKNGCVIMIDKFPLYPIWVTTIIEKYFSKWGVKDALGTHHYTHYVKFKQMARDAGFDIEEEMVKKPKSLKNAYVLRGFLVLRKRN